MSLRKTLLRVMLWSLGVAAATGVLAVLFRGGDLAWRVVGTGFATAVACGVLLPVSRLIEREKTRSAGLLGMAGIIVEFLLWLVQIWELPRHLFGVRWEGEIGLTIVLSGAALVLLMCFLRLRHAPHGALAGNVALAVILVTWAAFMLAIWAPHPIDDESWQTGGAVLAIGGLAVISLLGRGDGQRIHWRWGGIAAGIVAGAMWLIEIWVGVGTDLGFVIFCGLLAAASVVAHANLSLSCTLTREQRWVRSGALAAGILTALLLELMIIEDKFFAVGVPEDLLGRFAAAAGIVTGCGTLALFVLAGLNRRVDYEARTPELNEITVVCPRCRKKQALRVGDSACTACGLRISTRLEEPRCPQCDYLLYGLVPERCPECGMELGRTVLQGESGRLAHQTPGG